MSDAIYCPNCRIPIATTLFVEPVTCPQCGKRYARKQTPAAITVSQAEATPNPSPPMVAPITPIHVEPASVNTSPAFPKVRKRRSRRMQPVTSWVDLFDWKFEKYLTPWIVRATWVVCMAISALWILTIFLTGLIMLTGIPSGTSNTETASRSFSSNPYRTINPPPSVDNSSLATAQSFAFSSLVRLFAAFVFCITSLGAVVIFVLWVRVLLETAIVLFNMATSLASIDEKTIQPTVAESAS